MSVRTLVTEEDSINEDDDDPIVAEENKSKINGRTQPEVRVANPDSTVQMDTEFI